MIHYALAVTVLFLRPEQPGSDATNDWVQVVPLGVIVVLQQAAALQVLDGVCQFLRGGEEFRRLESGLDYLLVFLSA